MAIHSSSCTRVSNERPEMGIGYTLLLAFTGLKSNQLMLQVLWAIEMDAGGVGMSRLEPAGLLL